ncbi:MAG: hypothetical protein FJZ92_07210 [Chloroflexi bacterium]|nr:hypothetical protein [Chloroflexota bacterium]
MKPQSFRQSLILALIFTGIWGVVIHVTSRDQSIGATALSLPFFFAIILLTMRATNRLTVALAGRFGPKPKPKPAPPAPSTDRPEHAQRRRERRRRRGRYGRR